MLLLYIPMGYYTDLFIYRRRQARRPQQGQGEEPDGRPHVHRRPGGQENCFLVAPRRRDRRR